MLVGCQTNPETVSTIAQPKTPVVKTITNFSNSLRCMDDLFIAHAKQGIVITSDGIPDETDRIAAGTKDMLITALSKMTVKSRAVQFLDVERNGDSVFFVQTQLRKSGPVGQLPQYYVRGAITQFENDVADDGQQFSLGISPFLSLGFARDQFVSLMSLDMSIGNMQTWRIEPGLHTSNTIAIVSRSQGVNTEAVVNSVSGAFGIDNGRVEGSGQALRTLIELSMIELLGKLTKVPYWRCLELESTDPRFEETARDWYDAMAPEERVRAVQAGLQRLAEYDGPVDGTVSPRLRQAINRYKAVNELVPDGRVGFGLYYSLLTTDVLTRKSAPATDAATQTTAPVLPESPIGLSVRPAYQAGRALRAGDRIRFEVSVAQDADVYCYYEYLDKGQWNVARIFPSQFQPEKRLRAGQSIQLPPPSDPFSIELTSTGEEESVGCVATAKPYLPAQRPEFLDLDAFEPLTRFNLNRMFYVFWAHQQADYLNSDFQTVTFMVRDKVS